MRTLFGAALVTMYSVLSVTEIEIVTYITETDDDTSWSNFAADIGSISGIDIWGLV